MSDNWVKLTSEEAKELLADAVVSNRFKDMTLYADRGMFIIIKQDLYTQVQYEYKDSFYVRSEAQDVMYSL